MTTELQATAGTQLADDSDPLADRLAGEDLQMLEADGALGTHGLDRPQRGRMFDTERANVAARPSLELDGTQIEHVSALFKLLSDKTRLAILQILCDGEMNVTAMCRQLSLPQPTVSHHLGLLRMNRLISNRRSGKEVFYRLHERIVGPESGEPAGNGAFDGGAIRVLRRTSGLSIVDSGFSVQICAGAQA